MKRVGLFVGIDKYKDNGITQLKCAVKDATALMASFSKAQYDKVDSLLNDDARTEDILLKAESMIENLNSGDLFVFYFSGHGREINNSHYLVGPTARAKAEFYQIGSLPLSTLISITNKPGINRLFILDCCRSDILANRSGSYCCSDSRNIALNAAVKNDCDKSIIPPLILNSCSTGERAFEKENHGFFTETLLKSIDNRTITSFRDFQQSLHITGTPEPQNIAWNGNLIYWENIKLFGSWSDSNPAQPAQSGQTHSRFDVQVYETEVRKLTKELSGNVPAHIEELLQIAKNAAADGEYDSAIRVYVRVINNLKEELEIDPEKLFEKGEDHFDNENYTEAVKYFRAAADRNHAAAQYRLGECYANGWGVAESDEEAVKWSHKAAEQNNADAQYSLGWHYEHGAGVRQSDKEAVKWYTKAVNQGDEYAKKALELLNQKMAYEKGKQYYDNKNYTEAVKCFREAAEKNHAGAQNYLGECYYFGYSVPQSYEEAVKWYRKSAVQNDAFAQYNLGWCYAKGNGVPESYEEAVKWYRKAAEQNHASGQTYLGVCYYNGQGVPQSYEEAVKWFTKAAEQDYADAQHNLGVCYKNGQGVPQSYEEAVKWYRKAAEQNHASGQTYLAYCYIKGNGVPQSYEEAVKWHRKAAEQDYAAAQFNLGVCYKNGQGVPQSDEEAVKWFTKAANNGVENAKKALECLRQQQTTKTSAADTQKVSAVSQEEQDYSSFCRAVSYWKNEDYRSAFEIFLRLAPRNNPAAQYNLAVCFCTGKGTDVDMEKARYWLRKAIENGSKNAPALLEKINNR